MTDIRMLLHEAAPQPLRPLDMTALRARARRRTARRVITWLAGLGIAVGAGLPVGGSLLVSAGDVERADRVSPDRSALSTLPPSEPGAGGVGSGKGPGLVGAPGPTHPGEADPSPVTTATAGDTGGLALSPSDYPAAASCSVDTTGLGDGEQRRCRFTATRGGGTDMTTNGPTNPAPGTPPSGDVTVTRNGVATTYHVRTAGAGDLSAFAGCGDVIEPGDLVEVVLTNGISGDTDQWTTTLGAGEGWSC